MSDETKPLVLLTGLNGFVGAHVLDQLLKANYRVRGTVRSLSKSTFFQLKYPQACRDQDLTFIAVPDIQASAALDEAAQGVDFICHVASPFFTSTDDPIRGLVEPAVNGTRNVVRSALASKTLRKMTILSSFAAVMDMSKGTRPGYMYTTTDWNPVTRDQAAENGFFGYFASKTFAERAAWDMWEEAKAKGEISWDLVTLCPPMIYGPPYHEVHTDKGVEGLNTSLKDLVVGLQGRNPAFKPKVATPGLPAWVDVRDVAKAHSACVYELERERIAFLPAHPDRQAADDLTQSHVDTTSTATSAEDDESRVLGYANDTKGTPGIIRGLGASTGVYHESRTRHDSTTNKYASTIRELPAHRHVDFLVQAFFQNVAWHYDIVDEATFTAQLSQWSALSHKQLTLAPEGLPTSLKAFPALLFQVLAQALLFQPQRHDECLNDLKYAADMELSDRAAEYSDAGMRIASSFKKSELSLTIVQATLMRCCFEKTTGAVTEAWHTLGTAIREAQELGLHKLEPQQRISWRTETAHHDLGRKVWLMLHLWDAHMGIVLGRPMSTRLNPDDVPSPTPWDCSADAPRPPQPRDVILCGYHTAYRYLQEIHDLEKIDDSRLLVDNIHDRLLANLSNLPEWARPQRSRDCEPAWLPAALEIMTTNMYFVLFSLHRPFIFASARSRATAVYAATQILESQARLFDRTEPLQHKAFGWVFATFDATVLIVAVHVRFPEEFMGDFAATKENVEGALERLKVLRASNDLAGSAFRILQRLYEKMLEAATHPTESSSLDTGSSDGFVGMEADTLGGEWEDALLPDFGSYSLPPDPFNELLCNGDTSFGVDPAWQTDLDLAQLGDLAGFDNRS
ncbi:hypothetical protein BDY17DRAFT_321689 [Neohortaea acidophila]|uniref:Xylanolytic transcriptional activator regulatory domain-containing protein n=1 Tax=Neohortaea acidophila TaxID=245834 RepID=A0A6A6Q3G3_9PEZI|nr:uncharacterized protein BDY17DRAFT_321689 [Neohortaea acidophila]KAF2486940.1 hypothetical protein BDY17DRAFT_321689 [Neohortaea acidophila]